MLNNFFSPKSVAVIGASRNKKKLGFLIYENIRRYGFKGKLYGVNTKGGKLGTQKLYKTVQDIKDKVDLAVIAVPAVAVPEVVKNCGEKGISSVIIISAGFTETGAKGRKLEEQVKELSCEYNIRILGPNCLGIIDSWSKMNASFAESMPDKMNISLFSQSGAICTAILDWANAHEIGFSRFISLGNKLDIDENDILRFLAEDPKTDIVLGYLESIHDGTVFMSTAKCVSAKKPFVIVKSGTTSDGAKSISSHTGSIAGSDIVTDAALRESGVIRADSLEDLFDYAKIFALSPEMKGKRVGVISNAGGPAVMLADAISKSGLKLAKFSSRTKKVLEEKLPPAASTHNPIDVIGDARADRYESALEEVLKDENVDAVVVVLTPQVMTEVESTAKIVCSMKKYGKPIAVCFMGGERVSSGVEILEEGEIPSYDFPERAIKALKALYEYYSFRSSCYSESVQQVQSNIRETKKPALSISGGISSFSSVNLAARFTESKREPSREAGIQPDISIRASNFSKEKAENIIRPVFSRKQKYIVDGDLSAFDILDAYGIDTVKRAHGVDFNSLKENAEKVGYPVVLKTSIDDILHKTDIGGVKVGIRNESELQKAYFHIRDNIRKAGFDDGSDKVDIYKQEDEGIEIFLGAKKDENFGPLIIFGMGGIFVEALNDFSYRIAPVTRIEAKKMIDEIKSQKVLNGFRGMSEVNREKLVNAVTGLSQLMLDFPEIKEIDINPLKCTDKKCVAIDGKIILDI